ncbi:MAG: murein biosynthesis integral membrane protein MurJ [Propioniciclava sp.]
MSDSVTQSDDMDAPRTAPNDAGERSAAASRRLLNATAIMASGTLISRVLGFLKAMLLVFVLGASTPQADAYSLATVIPNTLYMILAGGALNTVLVPQIIRHTKDDADGGEAFINRIVTAFLVLLGVATVVATIFTPAVLSLWTEAEWRAPAMADHWQSLVFLAFLTMPQLFFFGAFFLVGQVLNARDRFGPMMWAPIVNNIVGITVLAAYAAVWGTNQGEPFTDIQILTLGIGSTLGIIAQTVALIPAMRAVGFRYRPRWDLRGQGLGATFHLAKWMLGYVLLTSLVQFLVFRLASGATVIGGDGEASGAGVAAYNTAYLVWILPHSLLTVSLATAMLPSASRLATAGDLPGVAAETTRTLRLALTFLVPAAAGFLILGLPFSRLALSHGAGETGWMYVGWTLMAFSIGLVPYTIQYLYLRGYYALDNTRGPFFLQLLISLVNVGLALGLVALFEDPPSVAPRLALAYAGAYYVGAIATHFALRRRLPGLSGRAVLRHVLRVAIATAPGAIIAAGLAWWTLPNPSLGIVLLGFAAGVLIILLSFFLVAKRLGIREASQLLSILRRSPGTDADGSALEPSAGPAPTDPTGSSEQPLLEYPDPGDRAAPSGSVHPDGRTTPGQILDGRYQLTERLHRRGETVTWLGFDLTLSRAVLIHLLHPDEPRSLEVLDQARRAAPAVDSRFLRVWDAVLVEGEPHGSYIVCEYLPAQSLRKVLRDGALSDLEAAWTVREVAKGLATVHAHGLHHRQLNPNTVVLTTSGTVKIVGFLLEDALTSDGTEVTDGTMVDVIALGRLLYALSTGFWPGSARYDLPAAPTDLHGRPLQPRQISTRISSELSTVVDRILARVPRDSASRLTTADEIAATLDVLLQGQTAATSLAGRVSIERPESPRTWSEPGSADSTLSATTSPVLHPTAPSATERVSPEGTDDAWVEDTDGTGSSLRSNPDAVPVLPVGPGSADDSEDQTESTQSLQAHESPESPDSATPIPPPTTAPRSQADPSLRWLLVLFLAFVGALGIGLVIVFLNAFERRIQEEETTTYPIVAIDDFDPSGDGGDDVENADQVSFAHDDDLSTAWTTEGYGRSADFNGRKPGAGLLIDVGSPQQVQWISVVLGEGFGSGKVLVPREGTLTTAPYSSVDDWQTVAEFGPASGEITLTLDAVTETRFVVVYLTELPKAGPNFMGAIHEVRVGG